MVAICVDAGTSVVKAVAFNDDGTECVVNKQQVAVERVQPGWAEQDMLAVWQAVLKVLYAVTAQIPDRNAVRFLAITAQGDGCWLIDDNGKPTGPAMLWNDGRATAIVEQWARTGILEKAFRLNGTGVFPGALSALLSWLDAHDHVRIERSTMALGCKDWIVLNLTGVAATEESDASFPFFDIRTRQYAPALLKLYNIEWAQRLLPPVNHGTTPIGTLRDSVARTVGLRAGIPVIAAPYDIAATAIGLGAILPGQAVSILGTTLCNEIVIDSVDTSGTPVGLLVCSGLPKRWLRGFATMCGTEAVGWLCNFIGHVEPAEITEMAHEARPGAGGLTFLPYLSPAGERAPFLNANARASLFGLSLEHSRVHIARAILEGLSFVIRECFEASQVAPTELNVCGGGAVSDLWCQIIADVTRLPVRTMTVAEVGARGALFVGLEATGMEKSIEEIVGKYVHTRKLYEPRSSTIDLYENMYHNFLEVRDNAARIWSREAEAREHLLAHSE